VLPPILEENFGILEQVIQQEELDREKKVTKEKINILNINNNQVTKKENKQKKEIPEIATEILKHYNEVFGRGLKSMKGYIDNLEYWLEDYSVEDIKQAITNAHSNQFWHDKMTPELLLRKQKAVDGSGEQQKVDRIGELLCKATNMVEPKLEECTQLAVWQVAKEFNVPYSHVIARFKRLVESVRTGEFQKHNPKMTTLEALKFWINNDLAKGYTGHCNEIEAMDIDNHHPDKVREMAESRELLRQLQQEGKW
jgi:hypothetical protein